MVLFPLSSSLEYVLERPRSAIPWPSSLLKLGAAKVIVGLYLASIDDLTPLACMAGCIH
jgi:hypothetical protein